MYVGPKWHLDDDEVIDVCKWVLYGATQQLLNSVPILEALV